MVKSISEKDYKLLSDAYDCLHKSLNLLAKFDIMVGNETVKQVIEVVAGGQDKLRLVICAYDTEEWVSGVEEA